MILVNLGTHNLNFDRLLYVLESLIKGKIILEEVVVITGYKKFKSEYMNVVGLLPQEEYEKIMKKSNLVISHGGVGSLLSAIKLNKKIIGVARLAEHKEAINNHQIEILEKFEEMGYLLYLKDIKDIKELILNTKSIKTKKFVSNTKDFNRKLNEYIKDF